MEPSALKITLVIPKYKAQVLAGFQIIKRKYEGYYPLKFLTVEGRVSLGLNKYLNAKIGSFLDALVTGYSPRRPIFLHAISFD